MLKNLVLYTLTTLLVVFMATTVSAQTDEDVVRITLENGPADEPLAFAACVLQNQRSRREYGAVAAADGVCKWHKIPNGKYTVTVMYMGREIVLGEVEIENHTLNLTFEVDVDPEAIDEVVVTASESQGMTSS